MIDVNSHTNLIHDTTTTATTTKNHVVLGRCAQRKTPPYTYPPTCQRGGLRAQATFEAVLFLGGLWGDMGKFPKNIHIYDVYVQ